MSRHETHLRSVVKGVTWRAVASLTTFIIVFAFTNEIVLSFSVSIIEIISKIMLYFFHERAWTCVSWGKVTECD